MDQSPKSSRNGDATRPIRVPRPHSYDGIGDALRSAYRDHREPPGGIANALNRLDSLD